MAARAGVLSSYYPPEGEYSELLSLSCTASSFCQAVGTYVVGAKSYTLGEKWNGTEWVHLSTYYPPEGEQSKLTGVSCVSASWCMSVGTYGSGAKRFTLAEYWNGTEWVHVVSYYPPEGEHSELLSVSCTASSFCQAVGMYAVGSKSYTLGEKWTGTEWVHLATYYPPASEHNTTLGVSCASASACQGVGTYSVGSQSWTLGQRWNVGRG